MKEVKNTAELVEALNLDPSIVVEWELRKILVDEIIKQVSKSDLKITQIAKGAKTSRARVHRILNNETEGISLDVISRVLGATGKKVSAVKFINLKSA